MTRSRRSKRKVHAPALDQPALTMWPLILLFMLSGATSLVYQTLWVRRLNLIFGTSELAICTVLAAFMGGLALGSFLAGRLANRIKHPVRTYALLELFIGVYAVAFPLLIGLATSIYLGFHRAAEPSPVVFGAFQSVLLGILLLPPTICMGATLPLLARFATRRPEETGVKIGRLYGANTLGAVVGTALAGFVLLPILGMTATTYWAALANGLLAAGAWTLHRCYAPMPAVPERPRSNAALQVRQHVPALLVVAGLAGFCGLVYELAWFRLLVLLLGGSAYAFSLMLFAFLLGIGLGGWIGGSWADRCHRLGGRQRVVKRLALLQVVVAVLSGAAVYAYGELPFVFVRLFTVFESTPGWLWIGNCLLALLVMLPPAMCMGASFPFLVRAAADDLDHLGGVVGRIYGVNTLGAIIGAIAGGMLFLPVLHVRGTILCAVSLNLLAAVTALWAAVTLDPHNRRVRFAGWSALAACAVVVIHVQPPPWNPLLMTSGLYKYVSDIKDRSRQGVLDGVIGKTELLFYDEGPSSVVTVGRNYPSGNIWVANNGKIEASTGSDMATQVLLGHLPFVFQPDAGRALVIGLGSGISAGSVTLHGSLEKIDLVELEPAIVEASHFFDEFNHRPLEDPRVRLHVNDARNHLMLTPDGTYDIVSSEPSNPWISGVSNLFTHEFFELGKRKLKPGGVWTQWLHLYGMAPDDVRSLLATFSDTYAYVRLFRVNSFDLILVGSDTPLAMHISVIRQMMQNSPAIERDLARAGLHHAEDLLARYVSSRKNIVTIAGDVERNTDDNMRIEYSAPLHLHQDTLEANDRLLIQRVEIPFSAVEGDNGKAALMRAYARLKDFRATFRLNDPPGGESTTTHRDTPTSDRSVTPDVLLEADKRPVRR